LKIYLIRHGETDYNYQKRYQGRIDIPLSERGTAALTPAEARPGTVYVSPLVRARQTAAHVFPDATQQVVEALTEMDFGVFDGRSAAEMEEDSDYRAWVEGGCEGRCPGGEDLAGFRARTCGALRELISSAGARGEALLAVVAHGGTLMAAMECFALPERRFYEWMAPCGGGYVLDWDEVLWREREKLRFERSVVFTREARP